MQDADGPDSARRLRQEDVDEVAGQRGPRAKRLTGLDDVNEPALGRCREPLDPARVEGFMAEGRALRESPADS
eukprot:1450409-Lingulodinium_polyedra.AAC.1